MIGLFQWRYGALRPADAHTIEMCARFKAGEILKAEPKRVRNYKQLCLWFSLCGVLAEHAEWCASTDNASDWMKIAIGHFDLMRSPDGKEWAVPKSIAYGNCDQTEFDQLLNKAIRVICEKVIPGTSNETLRAELEAMVMPIEASKTETKVARPSKQANGQDDDWQAIATDIVALIGQAPSVDRLEEITAIHERELTAMKNSAPGHYTRVMNSMERRGEELNRQDGAGESPERDPARQPIEAG